MQHDNKSDIHHQMIRSDFIP